MEDDEKVILFFMSLGEQRAGISLLSRSPLSDSAVGAESAVNRKHHARDEACSR